MTELDDAPETREQRLRRYRRTLTRIALKLAIGAAAGAVLMIVVGQILGAVTPSCSVVCKPWIAAKLGALVGMVAFYNVGDYRAG
jgi:putative Mn2+ efflux pump MntP